MTTPPMSLAGERILIYAMNYAPEFTSTGRYTGEVGAELARLGALVDVVTTPPHYPGWRVKPPYGMGYSSERLDGVRIVRCPLFLARSVRGVARLLAPLSFAISSTPVALWKLVRLRPKILLCVEPTLLAAPVAAFFARLIGVRTVLHVQDLEIDGAFDVGHLGDHKVLKTVALAFERLALRPFQRIVTISDAMRRRLVEKGVRAEKTVIIRNWVDLEKIGRLAEPNAYRGALGLPDDAFVVQYSGNIGAKQGLDLLCEAAEKLQAVPNIRFVLAGEGPDRARLQARFGQLPNLDFHDFQPEERMGEFLNAPDVHVILQLAGASDFALPSKLGGILASGRPLIVTAGPDQELARFLDGAAILIPPGDSTRLAEAIRAMSASATDAHGEKRAELARQLSRKDALSRMAEEIAGLAGTG